MFARPVLDPSVPFDAHTTEGEALRLQAGDAAAPAVILDGERRERPVTPWSRR